MATEARIRDRNENFQKSKLDSIIRSEYSVKLRKEKRMSSIRSKRFFEQPNIAITDIPLSLQKHAPELFTNSTSLNEKLQKIESLLQTNSDIQTLKALLTILMKLSMHKLLIPMIKNHPQLFQRLFSLLSYKDDEVKLTLTHCLCNFTTISMIGLILPVNIQALATLLKQGFNTSYACNIVWIVGNLASDSIETRDELLLSEVGDTIISAIRAKTIPLSSMSTVVWCLGNLLRGFPIPYITFINSFISIIPVLQYCNDAEILTELLWGISYITEHSQFLSKVHEVLDIDILVTNISKSETIQSATLRVIGNLILDSENAFTDSLVKIGIIKILFQVAQTKKRVGVREALWVLSNIAFSGQAYARTIAAAEEFNIVVENLAVSDLEVRYEAFFVLKNVISKLAFNEILRVFDKFNGIREALCAELRPCHVQITKIAILMIDRLFEAEREKEFALGSVSSKYIDWFVERDGVNELEDLQYYENDELANLASDLIKKYWDYYCE